MDMIAIICMIRETSRVLEWRFAVSHETIPQFIMATQGHSTLGMQPHRTSPRMRGLITPRTHATPWFMPQGIELYEYWKGCLGGIPIGFHGIKRGQTRRAIELILPGDGILPGIYLEAKDRAEAHGGPPFDPYAPMDENTYNFVHVSGGIPKGKKR